MDVYSVKSYHKQPIIFSLPYFHNNNNNSEMRKRKPTVAPPLPPLQSPVHGAQPEQQDAGSDHSAEFGCGPARQAGMCLVSPLITGSDCTCTCGPFSTVYGVFVPLLSMLSITYMPMLYFPTTCCMQIAPTRGSHGF